MDAPHLWNYLVVAEFSIFTRGSVRLHCVKTSVNPDRHPTWEEVAYGEGT